MNTISKIQVATQEGKYYFDADDIVRLEASSSYTIFYLSSGKKLIVGKVLKLYASLLESMGFLRTHQSHLINRRYIYAIHGEQIIMRDQSVAYISRRLRRNVIQSLAAVA